MGCGSPKLVKPMVPEPKPVEQTPDEYIQEMKLKAAQIENAAEAEQEEECEEEYEEEVESEPMVLLDDKQSESLRPKAIKPLTAQLSDEAKILRKNVKAPMALAAMHNEQTVVHKPEQPIQKLNPSSFENGSGLKLAQTSNSPSILQEPLKKAANNELIQSIKKQLPLNFKAEFEQIAGKKTQITEAKILDYFIDKRVELSGKLVQVLLEVTADGGMIKPGGFSMLLGTIQYLQNKHQIIKDQNKIRFQKQQQKQAHLTQELELVKTKIAAMKLQFAKISPLSTDFNAKRNKLLKLQELERKLNIQLLELNQKQEQEKQLLEQKHVATLLQKQRDEEQKLEQARFEHERTHAQLLLQQQEEIALQKQKQLEEEERIQNEQKQIELEKQIQQQQEVEKQKLLEEQIQKVKAENETFKKLDKNGDGKLSFEEAAKIAPKIPKTVLKKLFELADQSGDGFLQFEEMNAFIEMIGAEEYKEVDANKDGKISLKECQSYFKGISKKIIQQMFELADKSGDGYLQEDEFEVFKEMLSDN
ncbi:EF-hand_domain pair-containing protein [Hexamita inflata]|uniref:EF-hand domain pair-containing protein n=1 Tax=Hexamita inflata TaxID=28002 RepID=A0AA86U1H2_9EUKA|nr:EF-hand domain pair-containing protein [Hexamita inflata]